MTGRSRLPGGEPRKASQKRTRRAEPLPSLVTPQWRLDDRVSWGGRYASFVRSLNDGIHAEIRIEQRIYRCVSRNSDRGNAAWSPLPDILAGEPGSTRHGRRRHPPVRQG